MRPDEWARVKSVFEAAAAVPVADRERVLANATSDPELLRQVQLLLEADRESAGSIFFTLREADANNPYVFSNVRVATGAPDTRNKILTEGKWVSHDILFDVNSDRIKPESYGSLKEIAGILTETKDLKVQIVGHTDADGDEAANLDLSKRRAASVKAALTRGFGIDSGRMDTDGKGESQPVDKNDNPAGKANNRRVEFIKR